MELKCYKCQQLKSTESFSKAAGKSRNQWQAYCKPCMAEYRKTIPIEVRRARSAASSAKSKDTPASRLKSLLRADTVDRSALDFDWAWDKLEKQGFKCEITGLPFVWTSRDPQGLSIDRIDPNAGYTKENVRFVCWWVNAAMGNWGLDKLKELIKEASWK